MATSKKTASKRSTNSKTKKEDKKRIEPDFSLVLDDDSHFILDVYDKGDYLSAKLTCCDIFIVYAKVVVMQEDEYAFIAFPSYYREGKKGKKGEYINQAFFIDKDIIESMNTAVTEYIFSEE